MSIHSKWMVARLLPPPSTRDSWQKHAMYWRQKIVLVDPPQSKVLLLLTQAETANCNK